VIQPSADGSINLKAVDALIRGSAARVEGSGDAANIGFWTDLKDCLSWDFEVKKAGKFTVKVTLACDKGADGSTYGVSLGGQELNGTVKETGAWNQYVTEELGALTVDKPGKYTLFVRPKTMPHGAVMNLRAVEMKPQAK
jgi:hypothetical protein